MIWEILSLTRLQRKLNLGNSTLENHALERGLRVWLENLLLKRWGVWCTDLANHLSRSQDYRWLYPGRIYRNFYIMLWLLWLTWETDRVFWKHCIIRNTARKGQGLDKMKEGFWIPIFWLLLCERQLREWKSQATDWEIIFLKHIFDKGLISKMYKKVSKVKNKINNPL